MTNDKDSTTGAKQMIDKIKVGDHVWCDESHADYISPEKRYLVEAVSYVGDCLITITDDDYDEMTFRAKNCPTIGGDDWNVEPMAKDPAAEWQAGYEAGIEAAINALEADAEQCDCFAREEGECACGAWCEWKSITSAKAVEIVRALQEESK